MLRRFGLIPPPSVRDGKDVHERYDVIRSGKSEGLGSDSSCGYQDNLLQRVIASFEAFKLMPQEQNIHFVQGLYQDTF